jgi:hemoglobin-like flavoprotein
MTRDQIHLVQASFRNVLPIREQAAALFYDRLFEIDPGTRGLFADTDLRTQGGKLMAAIGMVVHALDAPESMVEKLKELARRHVNYGVENRHYATVGAALLWTLQVGLGESFTPELRDAWASAYNMLSERMMEAATGAASTHATTSFRGQLAEGRAGTLG